MKLNQWKTYTQTSEKESNVNIQQSHRPYTESDKTDIHLDTKPFNQGNIKTNEKTITTTTNNTKNYNNNNKKSKT